MAKARGDAAGVERVLGLRRTAERLQQEAARLKGAAGQLLKQLQESEGVESLVAGRKLVKQLERELATADAEVLKLTTAFNRQ